MSTKSTKGTATPLRDGTAKQRRNVRFTDRTWLAIGVIAAARGINTSDVAEQALREYVARNAKSVTASCFADLSGK